MKENLNLEEDFQMKVKKGNTIKLTGIERLFLPRFWNPIFSIALVLSFTWEFLILMFYSIKELGKEYFNIIKKRKRFV